VILSSFVAEPSLVHDSNCYFANHFIRDSQIVDPDINVARRE